MNIYMKGNGEERVPLRSEWPPVWLKTAKTPEKPDIPAVESKTVKSGLEHKRRGLERDQERCRCGAVMIQRRKYPRWRNYDCPRCGTLRDIWSPSF